MLILVMIVLVGVFLNYFGIPLLMVFGLGVHKVLSAPVKTIPAVVVNPDFDPAKAYEAFKRTYYKD